MNKFLSILFTIALSLPLYAQEYDQPLWKDFQLDQPEEPDDQPEKPKKPFSFARQGFEFGIDAGAGFDNDLIKMGDVLKKNIIIDLNQLGGDIRDSGLSLNTAVIAGLYFNIKNIKIKESVWEFGFFSGVDGNVKFNVPKSLFTLISEGNLDQRSFDGTISASGAVFANAGINSSAQFGKLRVGLKPAVFTPLVFIPKSGIEYNFVTKDNITVSTSGEISIYSPFIKNGEFVFDVFGELNFGSDVSVNGEYALLSFLDVGGSFSRIPLIPATVNNRMKLTMPDFNIKIDGEELMGGNAPDLPSMEFSEVYDSFEVDVFRPLRFDLYARYKPFSNEILVLRPNVGLSVNINDKQTYFNAGVKVQLNLLRDLIRLDLGTDYAEAIWTHQLGFALNLRAFELDVAAALRSESFIGSFQAQGFGLNLGLRFGW